MIINEIMLAVSPQIFALIVKCAKDEIDKLHAHLIERVEELEKQLASTPNSNESQYHRMIDHLFVLL